MVRWWWGVVGSKVKSVMGRGMVDRCMVTMVTMVGLMTMVTVVAMVAKIPNGTRGQKGKLVEG